MAMPGQIALLRNLEKVACLADLLCGMSRNGKRVRHGQQIVRIASIDATPAKMIGEPRGLCSFYQTLKTFLMLPVEFISRAEIHRYPVLDDMILFEDRIENFQGPAPVDHEILGNDLKPIDDRLFREDVPVMWHPQADPDAVFCESVEGICRHNL